MTDRKPLKYYIIDRRTNVILGTVKTLKAAIRSVDRRDNEYGACRYYHLAVYDKPSVAAA